MSPEGRLDAHQHFWQLERADYTWLDPSMTALYRDFLPDQLAPQLETAGVGHTILVQAAPTVEETRFLLNLAHRHSFIAGVVGWVDCESPSAVGALHELAADKKLIGIRPMVQDIEDPHWLLRPSLSPAIDALVELGLTFDALVRPQHLRPLLEFCTRYPQLCVVLDHAGKPAVAAGVAPPSFASWARDLKVLAEETSMYCKFSGLVTEAGSTDAESIKPFADRIFESFGPKRVIWGSDWPVCETLCTYQEWFDLSHQLIDHLGTEEIDAIFGEVARRAYRLPSTDWT